MTTTANDVREQLLHALDFNYVTGVLGYGTPEELLAAYDASRATADRAALRDRIDAVIREFPFDDFGLDDISYLLDSAPDTQEWVPKLAAAVLAVLPGPADRAAVLREAAQRLYTALFPAVYADMGQKAAEGVNRAVSELRRMADETPAAETEGAREPDPDCERCDGTGLDPDTYTVKDDVWTHQPCTECLPEEDEPTAGARQDETATDETAPGSTEPRPCRTFVSGGTVWCCEEGETDCPCVCHQPAAGARQDGEA